jgi:hypothetical protein
MRFLIVLLLLSIVPASGNGQITPGSVQITHQNYYRFVPSMPKLVGQTRASEQFSLYGDWNHSSYRDADVNGIDDTRQQTLAAIARRFSPILRRNNFSFPRNFRRIHGQNDLLMIDTWQRGERIATDTICLGWHIDADDNEHQPLHAALDAVIRKYDPYLTEARFVSPDIYESTVLYVDFPGSNPVTWREAYRDADPGEATVYTHFFIHEDEASTEERRFQLVAQHWFFYPFNDGANNHEGDWEHINVLITTPIAAQAHESGRLNATEVSDILAGATPLDALQVAAVDYYFHESVITLDYLAVQRDSAKSLGPWLARALVWEDTTYVSRTVRARLQAANNALATHPIGYIGGDNKGPDELMSWKPRLAGGAYNRNGHGTYPFPGTWHEVGPLLSTERVQGRRVPPVSVEAGRIDINDSQYVVFADENIILVPDWERIHPLLFSSAQAQRDWSWLVLPMRWGFPVSRSPGGGALEHTDLGNISPEAPTYQSTWNRVGSAGGWRTYDAHVVRVMLAPTNPLDRMRNGVGVLNWPIGVIGFIPGWNVVVTQLMPWLSGTLSVLGAPVPHTFRPDHLHSRYSSATIGMQRQFGGNQFARLLPHDRSNLESTDASSAAEFDRRHLATNAMHYAIQLHYGPKLVTENTFSVSQRVLTAVTQGGAGDDVMSVRGIIDMKELTGGFRYNVLQSNGRQLQAFSRVGWGWAWYNVRDVTIDGAPVEFERDGGYGVTLWPSRRWWPNEWYAGVGAEYFGRPRTRWLPDLGFGVRVELNGTRHRLGATRPGATNLGIVSRGDFTVSGVIGW